MFTFKVCLLRGDLVIKILGRQINYVKNVNFNIINLITE
jgi:hypothetical protein